LTNQEERKELCVELVEIENDLFWQLLRIYTRGTNYEEFWALVERLRASAKMRKSFCG